VERREIVRGRRRGSTGGYHCVVWVGGWVGGWAVSEEWVGGEMGGWVGEGEGKGGV
jgi:hypothetical protein